MIRPCFGRASLQPAHVQHRLGHNLGCLRVPASKGEKIQRQCRLATSRKSVKHSMHALVTMWVASAYLQTLRGAAAATATVSHHGDVHGSGNRGHMAARRPCLTANSLQVNDSSLPCTRASAPTVPTHKPCLQRAPLAKLCQALLQPTPPLPHKRPPAPQAHRSQHRARHCCSLLLRLLPGLVTHLSKHLSRTVCTHAVICTEFQWQ